MVGLVRLPAPRGWARTSEPGVQFQVADSKLVV